MTHEHTLLTRSYISLLLGPKSDRQIYISYFGWEVKSCRYLFFADCQSNQADALDGFTTKQPQLLAGRILHNVLQNRHEPAKQQLEVLKLIFYYK